MFGRKQRRIESLEAQMEALGPYFPVAREICDEAVEIVNSAETDEVTQEYDKMIESVSQRARAQEFSRVFGRLPIEKRHEILLKHFSDEELQKALEKERQSAIDNTNVVGTKDLQERAKIERAVDLSQVPNNSSIEIVLYDKDTFEGYTDPKKLVWYGDIDRQIHLKKYSADDFQVIADTSEYENTPLFPRLPIHSLVGIGCDIEGVGFEPVVFYGSRLDCRTSDDQITTITTLYKGEKLDLVVGNIEIGGKAMFGNNISPWPATGV